MMTMLESFRSDENLAGLIEEMGNDLSLQEAIMAFEPSGCWCISDGKGGYLKDAVGQYLTESLDSEAVARYWKALKAVDREAVAAWRAEREAGNNARVAAAFGLSSKGSTGGRWEDEQG